MTNSITLNPVNQQVTPSLRSGSHTEGRVGRIECVGLFSADKLYSPIKALTSLTLAWLIKPSWEIQERTWLVFILLSCCSNQTVIGNPACVCPTVSADVIPYSKSQDAYTDIQTHRPLQMHLLDEHTQFSVHLIVHSVSIKANLQVRSSCGPCSAEFCCRPLISLTPSSPRLKGL